MDLKLTIAGILIGVAAAAAGCVLAQRGSLLMGCVMVLIVACCFSGVFMRVNVGWFTLSIDRVVFVWLIGASVLQRWLGRTDPKPIDHADVALAVLLIVLALSTFTADWRNAGLGVARPVGRLFAGYLLPTTLYWIARQSALTERRVLAAFAVLVGFGVYLSVTGLLEVTQQWWLVFPRYIADSSLGLGFGCARGPMLQPVSFGIYVAVSMLIVWLWRSRLPPAGRWSAGTVLPLFGVALFLTYTRSVWLGTGLGFFTVFAVTLPRRWRAPVLSAIVATSLFVTIVKWDTLLSFPRGTESAAGTRQSAMYRLSFAYVSWRMFVDRPWLGVHFGHFPEAKFPYLADKSTSLDLEGIRPLAHHNLFLSLLTEAGMVGLSAFLALLAYWTTSAWRAWSDPRAPDWVRRSAALFLGTLALYVGLWMFHELSFAPIDHGLLFVLAGIMRGTGMRTGQVS